MADLKSTPGISTRLDGALGLSRRRLAWRKPTPMVVRRLGLTSLLLYGQLSANALGWVSSGEHKAQQFLRLPGPAR